MPKSFISYGNEMWLTAVSDDDKLSLAVNPDMVDKICQTLDRFGLNYYAYKTDKSGKIAFNKSDAEVIEKLLGKDFSNRMENFQRKNAVINPIIGNTAYRAIDDKAYIKKVDYRERDILLKATDLLKQKQNIEFSGKVYSNHTTLTFHRSDEQIIRNAIHQVEKMREQLNIAELKPLFTEEQIHVVRNDIDEYLLEEIAPHLQKAGFTYVANSNLYSTDFTIDSSKAEEFNMLLDAVTAQILEENIQDEINPLYTEEQIAQIRHVAAEYYSISFADRVLNLKNAPEISSKLKELQAEFDFDLQVRQYLSQYSYSSEQEKEIRALMQNWDNTTILEYLDESYTPEQIREYSAICDEVRKSGNVKKLEEYAYNHNATIEQEKDNPLSQELFENKFFINSDNSVSWIYYDSEEKSFIAFKLKYDDILNAEKHTENADDFFNYLKNNCKKHEIKFDSPNFDRATKAFMRKPDVVGLSDKEVEKLVGIAQQYPDKSIFMRYAVENLVNNSTVRNAHENSDNQEYRQEVQTAINKLVAELSVTDKVLPDCTRNETVAFINEYNRNEEMRTSIFDTVSEDIDIALTSLEQAREKAKEIDLPFVNRISH